MPPRDQPDQRLVLNTRRQTRRPPAPDEVVSYAPKARSKTPDSVDEETGEGESFTPAVDGTGEVTPPIARDHSLTPVIATPTLDAPDAQAVADANATRPLSRSPTPFYHDTATPDAMPALGSPELPERVGNEGGFDLNCT